MTKLPRTQSWEGPGSFPHPKANIKHPKHAVGTKNGGKKWENNREKTQTGIEFGFEQHLEQNNPPKIWKIWEFREGHRRNAIIPGAWEAAKAKPIRSKEILGITDQGEIKEGVIKA